MCTGVHYRTKNSYFGRNLDYDVSYNETIVITPRQYDISLRHHETVKNHYAMIGMATVINDFPLYYDATNEFGLSVAGLNFSGNAHYDPPCPEGKNITSFEFIPWLLGTCKNLEDVQIALDGLTMTDESFAPELPASPLHWLIADQQGCMVYEYTSLGGHLYDNPVGVLTNNPPFPYHLTHLQDYLHVSNGPLINNLLSDISVEAYSRGMGALGLPGDLSSASRFVRAAYTKLNSVSGDDEASSVQQFFDILDSVAQTKGCCYLGQNQYDEPNYEYTLYSSCCNMDKGIYYYKTHENSNVTAVDMHHENLEANQLIIYNLDRNWQVRLMN